MRFLTILPLLIIGTSSYLVARARNAPRNVQFRASVEGNVLAVRGELEPASAPWLASDVRLYSTARDGTLGIVRVAAFDASGRATRAWQTSVESGASTVVVASNAKSLEIDVSLDALVSGNTSMGYASEDGTAIALPIRRFLFGAGGRSRWSVHSEANELLGPEWLDRGLYLAGQGWSPLKTRNIDVIVGPGIPKEKGAYVGELADIALARLADAAFPPPHVRPCVLLIECARRSAFARFDLPLDSEVYVVPCRDGTPLESGVFRDLAASAANRLARSRPASESVLWRSFEGPLAVQLARAARLRVAEVQAGAARRGYVGSEPVRYTPAHTPNTADAFYWFLHEHASVYLWERFLVELSRASGRSWSDWCAAVAASGDVDIVAATRKAFGEEVATDFHNLLYRDEWHVDEPSESEAGSFPVKGYATECEAAETASSTTARLTLAITGLNLGFLDNCGCTRNQGGGAGRRKTMLDEQRTKESDTIVIDVGDTLAPPFSMKTRDEPDAEALLRVLKVINYDVLVPGISELAYDAEWLRTAAQEAGVEYCVANVVDRATGRLAFKPTIAVEREARIVHVLGLAEVPYERYFVPAIEARVEPQYELRDAFECARTLLASSTSQETWILAGTITPETTQRLMASDVADRIDAIVTGSWRVGRLLRRDMLSKSNTYLQHPLPGLYATESGRTAYFFNDRERHGIAFGHVDFSDDGIPSHAHVEFQFIPSTVVRNVEVERILADHANRQAGDPATWPRTPLASLPEEQRGDAGYAGAATCGRCHESEFEQWRSTRHSRAMNELAGIAKEHDVACLKCHTTGFHWKDGFEPGTSARHSLENVQCEVCHGPGAMHVRRYSDGFEAMGQDTIRRAPQREVCISCHDEENSPGFRFDEAIFKVRH